MSKNRLKRLAEAGDVVGYPDPEDRRGPKGGGVWIFDRYSLDAYRLSLGGQDQVSARVDEIAKGMGL